MAMDMVIMQSKSKLSIQLSALSLLLPFYSYAELTISPVLTSNIYAYGIKDQSVNTDKGMAYEVTPSLDIRYKGPWLSSSLSLDNKSLMFDDAQRDNQNMFSYRLDNKANFLNDALSLGAGLSQSHRRSSDSRSRYQDEISGTADLARVESQYASASFSNDKFDWAHLQMNLAASRVSSNGVETLVDDLPGSATEPLDNTQLNAGLSMQTADRNRKFFWGMEGSASKTDRDKLASQYNRRAVGVIGVPFFWRVAMIANGAVESNSSLAGASSVFAGYRNYRSVGGGLEWKITDRSWWNVTYNKVNSDAEKNKEYIGTAFELIPSSRTKLSGSLDRRFFGRTATVKGSYQLKHLRMEVSVNDTVGSLLGFSEDDLETSLFVCPPGVVPGLDNCFQPPTANYIPAQGERFFDVTRPVTDLTEFIVVRRNASYLIGYSFNRLKLSARIGERKDTFVERQIIRSDTFVNLSANWQLNSRNSLNLSTDYSDMSYEQDGTASFGNLTGISKAVTLGLDRKINPQLSANFNIKRVSVDYDAAQPDYSENRAWLGLEYKF